MHYKYTRELVSERERERERERLDNILKICYERDTFYGARQPCVKDVNDNNNKNNNNNNKNKIK